MGNYIFGRGDLKGPPRGPFYLDDTVILESGWILFLMPLISLQVILIITISATKLILILSISNF